MFETRTRNTYNDCVEEDRSDIVGEGAVIERVRWLQYDPE